jgi:hypothetical protein
MIFRIINADGSVAMSLDYPDPTVPLMYLKEGQSLYAGDENSRLHINDDRLFLVDGVLQSTLVGPSIYPFNGEGDVLTKVEPENAVDRYLAVPSVEAPQT